MEKISDWKKSLNSEILLKLKCILAEFFVNKANDKPYKCDQCDGGFKHKHMLLEHTRIHISVNNAVYPSVPNLNSRSIPVRVQLGPLSSTNWVADN